MAILSGFFKTKKYRKTTDGYKLESNWTSGNTVELDDGNTVQNNLGAIKGITTSTSVTETGYAADATTVAALNESLENVNKNLFTTHSEYKTSANTLKKNGIYYSTTWLDTAGNYGVLIVFGDNSSYISQFFINAVDGSLWFRNTNNGTTWIEWKRIV